MKKAIYCFGMAAIVSLSSVAHAEECIDQAVVTEVSIRVASELRLRISHDSQVNWYVARKSDWGNSEDVINRFQSIATAAFLSGNVLHLCHDETVVSGGNSSSGYITRMYLKRPD